VARNDQRRSRRNSQLPLRSREFLGPAAAIFFIAFAIRAVHIWQIRDAPFFSMLVGDSRTYDAWARQIARGDWLGSDVFYQAPLYPYFLGLIYTIAGTAPLVVRVCQAVVGSLACVLLGFAALRFFSRPAGIAAGLMLALYAPAIFFDALIQKSVLDVFFVCLMVALLGALVVHPAKRSLWLGLGLAAGGLTLTRENAVVLAAVIVLWALARGPRPPVRRVAHAGAFLLGVTIVIAPVAARNAYVGGELHLTTSQFGPNLFIGNNPGADGTYMALRAGRGAPEYERQDATELAERASGRPLTPGEVSDYWTRRALAFVREQPAAWLRLMARKIALVWNATEMLDTESQASHAEWSAPLRLLGGITHFGVLVPLAFFGVCVTWPQRERLWILYALLIAYAASVVLFYVFARYRYPLVPLLIVFAAGGITTAREFFRASQISRIVASLAAAGAVAILANWPLLSEDLMRAITETNLGTALHEEGRLAEAAARYRRALAISPGHAPAHNNLAATLRAQGRYAEAIAEWEEALRLQPDYRSAADNLANALRQRGSARASQGEFEEGIADLRRAVALRPDEAAARYDLGSLLLERGRHAEAIQELRASLRVKATPEAHNNLGIALGSMGDLDEAIAEFRAALALKPDFADARRNLETALHARDRK
jgi:tetratricopeptide (TPR) repeat protein